MGTYKAWKICFIAFLLGLLVTSCGLQKRIYTKGFYTGKQQTAKKREARDTSVPIALALKNIKQFTKENYAPLFAQLSKANRSVPVQTSHKTFVTGECDTIFFGERVKRLGRIVKLTHKTVSYYPCDLDDSTILVIGRREVKMIHFANGRMEPPSAHRRLEKKYDPADYTKLPTSTWAAIGFVLTFMAIIVSFLLLSVTDPILVGIIIGAIVALALAGFILNMMAVTNLRRADNPKLVLGLSITDSILSGLILFGFFIAIIILWLL